MMNFPLSYIALELGCPPESTLIVAIFVGVCCLVWRLFFLKKMTGLSINGYLRNVCLNVVIVTIISATPTWIVYKMLPVNDWVQFIVVGFTSVVACSLAILYVGCTSNERQFIVEKASVLKKKFL